MKLSERDSLVNYRNPELSMQNDSPVQSKSSLSSAVSSLQKAIGGETCFLAVSVIFLMVATAGERVTFKMAVDRMVPFRFVLIQLFFMTSVLIYSAIKLLKQGFSNRVAVKMKEFPPSQLLIMAVLDTVQFAGLTVSAAGVSPTMTVILLHTSTPFLVLGSKYTFPNRKYSLIQMRGAQLIALAVLICLLGSFSHSFFPGTHQSDPSSSLLYVGMSALHGLATLYKEKSIIEWSQPIDIYCLSSKLFMYQFAVAFVLGPFIYMLQGISSNWEGYPLDSFLSNVLDGFSCFLGFNPDGTSGYDSSSADCSYSNLLVLGYVTSNIIVLECIDRVLRTSNQILERAMAAAVFVAFLTLLLYDNNFGSSGCAVDLPNMVAIITLLTGMEIYGRDPEPDVEAVTGFVPI